jgi:hypothetical protein
LEVPTYTIDYVRVLEAAKGFEFDDDEIFCPFNLLTEDDVRALLGKVPPNACLDAFS